jgi:hypothetical protein
MPIFILLVALFIPRVIIVLLWLLTAWFQGVFASALWPLIGFLFLPMTTLWYSVVMKFFGGEWAIVPIIGGIIAALIDISPLYRRRRVILVEA